MCFSKKVFFKVWRIIKLMLANYPRINHEIKSTITCIHTWFSSIFLRLCSLQKKSPFLTSCNALVLLIDVLISPLEKYSVKEEQSGKFMTLMEWMKKHIKGEPLMNVIGTVKYAFLNISQSSFKFSHFNSYSEPAQFKLHLHLYRVCVFFLPHFMTMQIYYLHLCVENWENMYVHSKILK